MKISAIQIKNFKCFEDVRFELHPNLNVLLGDNGTGKTSILEAFRILIGSLYLGYDKYDNKITMPGVINDDIRLRNIDDNLEPQLPTYVCGEGYVDSIFMPKGKKIIKWKRAMESRGGKTTTRDAKDMLSVSEQIQCSVREGLHESIPAVIYFSTDRYKKERRDTDIALNGSRMRGYFNALDSTTSTKFFLDLFYTETLDELQNKIQSPVLSAVINAVATCLQCKSLKYDLKKGELMVQYAEGDSLPFNLLSDGVRCTLAMVMEIALRCCLLNPHLKEKAPELTKGIVLIDEIDLHLHPSWQLHVLNDLRKAFPGIQFIVSTHAPLVVSHLQDCKILKVSERQVYNFPKQNGRDANYILKSMGVDSQPENVRNMISRYFSLIDQGLGRTNEALNLRSELDCLLGSDYAELQRADMLLSFL